LLVLAHPLLVLSCPTSLLVEPWPCSMSLYLPWLFPHFPTWRWRQYNPPEQREIPTQPHDTTSWKIVL
jgi:hypothetical protein